jgi:hypothetical protein
VSALGRAVRLLFEPVPTVPPTVERNLKVAAKAQEIAEDLKHGDPAVIAEVLTQVARLLDLGRVPVAAPADPIADLERVNAAS